MEVNIASLKKKSRQKTVQYLQVPVTHMEADAVSINEMVIALVFFVSKTTSLTRVDWLITS